jgi:ribosomal protein S18 acetylase RimI-like enzyme
MQDGDAIWAIMKPIIQAGETYALDRDLPKERALSYWLAPDKQTFVVEENNALVGTYYLKANQGGGGSHVCNCGYMVAGDASGRGLARYMCEHSIALARQQHYSGMQFNFVVSTNERAVRLWRACGFEIVGRLPRAFRHPRRGLVDAFVMFLALRDPSGQERALDTDQDCLADRRNWSDGPLPLFFCPSHPKLWVRKPSPRLGWTLNCGHRHAGLTFMALIVGPLLAVIVASGL